MHMANIPFGTTDWAGVEPTTHKGETGVATLAHRASSAASACVIVEYSPGILGGPLVPEGAYPLLCRWRVAYRAARTVGPSR